MSSTPTHSDAATERSRSTADPMRLEVVVVEPTDGYMAEVKNVVVGAN